jgi:hypothetical protein
MSKRASGFARHENDFYPTPAKAVPPLIPHLRAARVRRFVEPCCGAGDLVRHLESFGLICSYAGDIASGQDAITIPTFDSPVITNPPYARKLMHALIRHFIATAPCAWLLLEYDWTATKQARTSVPVVTPSDRHALTRASVRLPAGSMPIGRG